MPKPNVRPRPSSLRRKTSVSRAAIHGVAVREAFTEADDDEDPDAPEASAHDRWSARPESLPRNDVFIVEGSQLRYGSKDAWDAAYRG